MDAVDVTDPDRAYDLDIAFGEGKHRRAKA